MQQPKFKFGDKLDRLCEPGSPFVVTSISVYDDTFVYAGEGNSCGSREDVVKLYQEPQKKKLYAFKKQKSRHTHYDGSVKWTETILMSYLPTQAEINMLASYEHIFRDPEYDIEYPEPK